MPAYAGMIFSMNPTIQYLYSLQIFGMKMGLKNIRILLHAVGNPQKKLKTIHVAGTNGKGSTASMIASILTAAGYSVGLYTSPHLVTFHERIRINGSMISDKDVVRYTKRLRPAIDKHKATFFEATTAMAFRYFVDKKVDVAVIETGLGGRLDSTNVLRPIVSVITSIGLDHTEQLGPTITSIAFEKGGIIKKNVPVVIGKLPPQAKKVMSKIAQTNHSPLLFAEKLSLPESITLELQGKYQYRNAQCALGAIMIATKHFVIGDRALRKGLEHTSRLSGIRARCEIIQSHPSVVMDVAHNPDGIKNFVEEVMQLNGKKIVIFGVMKDKAYDEMLETIAKLRVPIVVTQPPGDRALSVDELFVAARRKGLNCFYAKYIPVALAIARENVGKDGLIVVTGSHYLVGEALKSMKNRKYS